MRSRTSLRSGGSSYCSICEEIKRKKNALDRQTRHHSLEHENSFDRDNRRLDFNRHHHHTHDDYLDHSHHHHNHSGSGHHHHHRNHERWTILPWPIGGRRSGGSLHEHDHKERIEIIVKQQPASAAPPFIVRQQPQQQPQQQIMTNEQRRREALTEREIELLKRKDVKTDKEIELLKRITKQQEINRRLNVNKINEITRETNIEKRRYVDDARYVDDRRRGPNDRRDPNYDRRSRDESDPSPRTRKISRGTQDDKPFSRERIVSEERTYRVSEGIGGSDTFIPVASRGARQDPRSFGSSEVLLPDDPANDDDPKAAAKKRGRRANPNVDDEPYPQTERPPISDLGACYNCNKGRFVKKFTWTGIIAALICFPCGIYYCFKMRTKVCSYCGILEDEDRNHRRQ